MVISHHPHYGIVLNRVLPVVPHFNLSRELCALHFRVTTDYAVLAELSKGLSGGDIQNVRVNAIYAGSVDQHTPEAHTIHLEAIW